MNKYAIAGLTAASTLALAAAAALLPSGAEADNAEPFDRLKQQFATYETIRVWAGVQPPIPPGETLSRCERFHSAWCPTSWVITATADGRMAADLETGAGGVYHRTLVDGETAITYTPGDTGPMPTIASEVAFLTMATQFVRQELPGLPVTVGTAEQFGVPPRYVTADMPLYRVTKDVEGMGLVELVFAISAAEDWVGVYLKAGGQVTRAQISGVEFDEPVPDTWFEPFLFPHAVPQNPRHLRMVERATRQQ